MILKAPAAERAATPRAATGRQGESTLAFYLARAFGDDRRVLVLNDMRLALGAETAQIDHLVLHPFGLAIVESKNFQGRVEIDRRGHWRFVKGRNRQSIPSPLRQAENQRRLLRVLLASEGAGVLPRWWPFTPALEERRIEIVVALGDRCLITRTESRQRLDPRILKAEDLVPRLQRLRRGETGPESRSDAAGLPARLSRKSLWRLGERLLALDEAARHAAAAKAPDATREAPEAVAAPFPDQVETLPLKHTAATSGPATARQPQPS